jgi:hypothetical protein
MADVAIDRGGGHGADHLETTTGLPHTKLAMWIFLASECMLFGALITTYVLYRGRPGQPPPHPHEIFDIPYTSVSSFVLLASSLTMVLALSAAQQRVDGRMRRRLLTRPLVALVVANGVLFFIHWPEIVSLSVRSELAHFSLHTLLLGSALVMWWPVLSPLPEFPSLSRPGQLIYLFFQSLAPTIPASFLTFGTKPLYPIYATFPRIWGIDPLTDQLIAGLVMKLIGGLILWVVIAAIFFRWGHEETTEGWDALKFRNVEQEIRAGMGR